MSILIPTKNINVLIREYGVATLNDVKPPAPSGSTNVSWQTDTLGNVSAYTANVVPFNPRGTWSSSTTYNIGDVVNFNGSSYTSIINNNINNQPDTSTADWQVLAQGGGDVVHGTATAIPYYATDGTVVSPSTLTTDGTNLTLEGTVQSSRLNVFANDGASRTPAASDFQLEQFASVVGGGGWNFGNAGGWTTNSVQTGEVFFAQRGIAQFNSGTINHHAVGDTAGLYFYTRSDGGIAAGSDEGVTGATFQSLEPEGYFHGTVAATTGTGDQAPTYVHTSGSNWTTDGAFMLNITKGDGVQRNMTGASTSLSLTTFGGVVATFLNKLPVSGSPSLLVSTAIGIATAAIANPGVAANNPASTSVTVNLAQIGGIYKPFTVGSAVTVAGNSFPEQSILTAVTAPNGSQQQTLTLRLRNPNTQAVIFQGGIQGQYISFDANLALSGFRSSYYAFGSLTGNDLIYGLNVAGGLTNQTLPMIGSEAAQSTGANSGLHLYPGAEVVNNVDATFNCTLEQNRVAWANGDVVENPHYPVYGGSALLINRIQTTPSNPGFGSSTVQINMDGPGTGGGNTYAVRINNGYMHPENYLGAGGPLQAPGGIVLSGAYNNSITIGQVPDTGTIFLIGTNPNNVEFVDVLSLNYNLAGKIQFQNSLGRWIFKGQVDAQNGFAVNHVLGATGTFTTADSKTVTVSGGLVMSIV